ncbi:ABC transporter ATP-binding protein, partial [Bifidobacterium longum]
GVEVPDYVKITRALGGPIAITEEPAIRMAKEALS